MGSPNRILREEVDGKVIIRTGRRIPGVTPVAGVHYPIAVVRMAVGDAYGAEQWREEVDGDEIAFRTERISRSVCTAVAEYSFRTAARIHGRVYGGPKWTVSPVYEGMLKEEMDAAAERHPEVPYNPVLIDATYAGLITGAADAPLVIPALNRDGDCLSDLVLPLFGSIAGAESVLLALDDDYEPRAVMAEAPHGTAPALLGKDIANPMAMILAGAALLHYAGETGVEGAHSASRAIYEARARGHGRRRPHARPRRQRLDQRVHHRGDRARAHEDRHLVVARLGPVADRPKRFEGDPRRRGHTKAPPRTRRERMTFWLGWWAFSLGLWMLLVFKTEPAEIVLGAVAAGSPPPRPSSSGRAAACRSPRVRAGCSRSGGCRVRCSRTAGCSPGRCGGAWRTASPSRGASA